MTYITLKQWAALHGVALDTPTTWRKRGKLPAAKKIGRDWLIPADTPLPPDRRFTGDPDRRK